jgi:hypothetical protein
MLGVLGDVTERPCGDIPKVAANQPQCVRYHSGRKCSMLHDVGSVPAQTFVGW